MQKPKILILRLSSLGDVVHASAGIQPWIESGYEVSFVTKKAFAPLLKNFPGLEVYEYQGATEAQARAKFLEWFGAQNFQFVLDFHDSWRTWKWRKSLKSKCPVIVAKKQRFKEFCVYLFKAFSFGRGGRALRYRRISLDVLAGLNLFPSSPSEITKLYLSPEELDSVNAQIPQKEFAALLPGSAWKGKEWPYFSELAAVLAKKVPIVVLGGEKDKICDVVAQEAQKWNPESRNLKGQTNLRESMAILAKAKWIIGNDTGLIHAAEALGKDVAVIEGPTHELLGFSPYRPSSILLGLPLFCRPCSKAGKICLRFGSRKCLNDLSAAMVLEKLRRKGYPC